MRDAPRAPRRWRIVRNAPLLVTRGEQRIEQLLRQHAGQFFCVGCLGFALRLGFEELLAALRPLERLPRVESVMERCSNCRQVGRVIRVRGDRARRVRLTTAPSLRAALVLRREPGTPLCDVCLALAADVSLDEARTAMETLAAHGSFERARGQCAGCQRPGTVNTGRPAPAAGQAADSQPGATGVVNPSSGSYLSACCGGRIRLGRGSPFPTCRWCLDATTWVRVARLSA